jgi:hypothetical protein
MRMAYAEIYWANCMQTLTMRQWQGQNDIQAGIHFHWTSSESLNLKSNCTFKMLNASVGSPSNMFWNWSVVEGTAEIATSLQHKWCDDAWCVGWSWRDLLAIRKEKIFPILSYSLSSSSVSVHMLAAGVEILSWKLVGCHPAGNLLQSATKVAWMQMFDVINEQASLVDRSVITKVAICCHLLGIRCRA